MDALVIQLGVGLGLHNAIGWFPPIYAGLLNILPMLLTIFFYLDKSKEYQKSVGNQPEMEYDFIIVGAGSAGCVVANRLSKHFTVLLLEQGGEPNPLQFVPGLQSSFITRPETASKYLTAPQNYSCLGMYSKQCLWKSGFGLGGGSTINGMVYSRGHPFDFDRWARVTKDERWNYQNVLPFFLRSEGYCGDCEPGEGLKPIVDPKYHNSNGELTVRPPSFLPYVEEFLEGQKWAGIERGDMNAPYSKPIADVIILTTKGGRRMSTYQAFVAPLLGKRSTLTVIKYATVFQVLFKDGTNEAIGVKYERFGKMELAKARKEVILSAGTISTPKLLMLSGIGQAEDLKKLNIPVKFHLPVGQNLHDHVGTSFLGPFIMDAPPPFLKDTVLNELQADRFLANGTGPFTGTGRSPSQAQWSSSPPKLNESEWPDLQIFMSYSKLSPATVDGFERNSNMNRDILTEYLEPLFGRDSFFMNVAFTRPNSRGSIKLKSNNFRDDPLIDPRYLGDPMKEDVGVLVEAIQRVIHLVENAPSYKNIGARLSSIPFPPCKNINFRSEEYWECFISHCSSMLHHYAGTASMGPVGSPDAVVDPELRVIGIPGLRVIDASIMPFVVSTNTNAAAIMIGERGAEFIISEYLKLKLPRQQSMSV